MLPLWADTWAEKTLKELSTDEKIGQLFMIAGYVDSDFAFKENAPFELDHIITHYHVGGIAFVGPSETTKQIALTNHYQHLSKIPILIAQDLEWGLGMRHLDGMSFPKNTTLGAIVDNQLIYELGKEIGRQAKLIGVHMNLSPVLDINSEPENIVINVRSFGSSPQIVAEKGIAMIKGLQDAGIIASAKHFPGLGDITTDPHLNLPCSKHTQKRLEEIEFYPFAKAIEAGVLSIQTEHLMVPALDPDNPASLSPHFVTAILKNKLGFSGLILSGALRMKALSDHFTQEEIAVKAFLAGSDILLMPQDVSIAFSAIKKALSQGQITESALSERVLKILKAKEKMALHTHSIVPLPTHEQLHTPRALTLKQQLYDQATTLIRGSLPSIKKQKTAFVQLGEGPSILPPNFLFSLTEDPTPLAQKLLAQINTFDQVILSVYPADPRRITSIRLLNEQNQKEELKHFRVHGIPESFATLAKTLLPYQNKITVVYFGNPYGLPFFDGYANLIMAYEPDMDAIKSITRLISF